MKSLTFFLVLLSIACMAQDANKLSECGLTEEEFAFVTQEQFNQALTGYATKLKSCGVLNERQYDRQLELINRNAYRRLSDLLNEVREQVSAKKMMDPDQIMPFVEKLRKNSIAATNNKQLITDINNRSLDAPIELVNYFDRAATINPVEYPAEPEKYLELIHRKTASILPELTFTNFEFQIVADTNNPYAPEEIQYDFICSLKSHGRTYKQKSFYRFYFGKNHGYSDGGVDPTEYYQVFNKILADLQSAYRLHHIIKYGVQHPGPEAFTIIALTSQQSEIIKKAGLGFAPSFESFENTPTTDEISRVIDEYRKLGLLKHLTEDQITTGKEQVAQQDNKDLNNVLSGFPDVIYWFDTELGNLEDPYAELTKEFSKITHGVFNPTDISDNFNIENKNATIKFKVNGIKHEAKLEIEDDWVDPRFFEFLNKVIRDSGQPGKFYFLEGSGQDARVIFLTPEQYSHLRTNNLLRFGE